MRSSSLIPVVRTSASVWMLWLWLWLVPLSPSAAHRASWTTNVCKREDMPTVVLAKDKRTGMVSVLQRYAPGELVPPLNEFTSDPKARHLERGDYDSIPSSSSKAQPGGLRSRQVNGQFPGHGWPLIDQQTSSSSHDLLESFDPRDHRFLQTNPTVGDNNTSSNDTVSVSLEDFELLYAR